MSKNNKNELVVWQANQPTEIAADATVSVIAHHARALTTRDVKSISSAFDAGSYEMVSTFVWTRAITGLKKQIGELGMEFVGQMLRRQGVTEDSDPIATLSEHDAITLAENLGMINTTEVLRLKQSHELVAHFSDPEIASQEQMAKNEAEGILRSCVTSILGNPHIKPPIQFAELKQQLESESFLPDDSRIDQIAESPDFVHRTVLSVLLSMLKVSEGAELEHAVGNTNAILPKIWSRLRKPEKWQVGQVFAEVHSAGRRKAATGLKNALSAVNGFDFVPETLRSETFAKAAQKVIDTHFEFNNFYLEAKPLRKLSVLGTTIPQPAFPICMRAVLCSRLGNYYGVASAAQATAHKILERLRKEQWEYYLNECLPTDTTIIDKLAEEKPATRWRDLVEKYSLSEKSISDPNVEKLVIANDNQKVRKAVKRLRRNHS